MHTQHEHTHIHVHIKRTDRGFLILPVAILPCFLLHHASILSYPSFPPCSSFSTAAPLCTKGEKKEGLIACLLCVTAFCHIEINEVKVTKTCRGVRFVWNFSKRVFYFCGSSFCIHTLQQQQRDDSNRSNGRLLRHRLNSRRGSGTLMENTLLSRREHPSA